MNHKLKASPPRKNRLTQRLKHCMKSRHAVNMETILQHTGAHLEPVLKALKQLVDSNQVEVLRPVSIHCHAPSGPTLHPLEHYRLVRPADRDFVWQVYVQEPEVEIRQTDSKRTGCNILPTQDSTWLLPWLQYACMAG